MTIEVIKTDKLKEGQKSNPKVLIMQNSSAMLKTGFTGNKPTLIEQGPLRFVITDSSTDSNIKAHVQELRNLKVKHVCRAVQPTYSVEPLQKAGISVHEMAFRDGDPPPEDVLKKWLKLVEQCFYGSKNSRKLKKHETEEEDSVQELNDGERVSVHCVAGLGRAPVLVAVALVEFINMEPEEAVKIIRKVRRGAINDRQFKWLENYQPKKRQQNKATCQCIIA